MTLTFPTLHLAIGGQLAGNAPADEATCLGPIVVDSRQVQPGSVFWALPGTLHDGVDFAEEAFDRGATGVVAARAIHPPQGRWAIRVDDSLRALHDLARSRRNQFAGRNVAVTGSVGKTTTRQMIDTVLRTQGVGITSPHNYNNHVGLPLSMVALSPEHDYAVFELGASGPGEIAALAELCAPQIGVITCIGDAHLGHFGSQQAIAQAKLELIDALPVDGWAVLNGDDPWLRKNDSRSRARRVWFGRGSDCDVLATQIECRPGELRLRIRGRRFRVPVWGRHFLAPVLAAVAVGEICDVPLAEIADALSDFQAPAMRCQVSQIGGATVINDSYNACPMAMRAALELLRDVDAPGRRIVVCGDMRELGPDSDNWHRRLGDEVVTLCGADWLLACGAYAADVVVGARRAGMPAARAWACESVEEAALQLKQTLASGDAVLIKGSRAMGLERVVDQLGAGRRLRVAA